MRSLGAVLAILVGLFPLSVSGQAPGGAPSLTEQPIETPLPVSPPLTAEDLRGLSDLVRTVALKSLPRDYENTKEWGSTKEVWAGVKVSQDGLREFLGVLFAPRGEKILESNLKAFELGRRAALESR